MQSQVAIGNYVLVNQKYILLYRPELTLRIERSQERPNMLLLRNVRPWKARQTATPSAGVRGIDVLAEHLEHGIGAAVLQDPSDLVVLEREHKVIGIIVDLAVAHF